METLFGDNSQSKTNGDAAKASAAADSADDHKSFPSPEDTGGNSSSNPLMSPITDLKSAEQYIFSNANNRKEIALRLALSGQSLEDALKSLKEFYSAKQKRLENSYRDRLARYHNEIGESHELLNKRRTVLLENRENLAKAEATLSQLKGEEPLLQQQENDAWHELLHHRFTGAQQFFESQHRRLETELGDKRQQAIADMDAQIEIDRKLFEIQKRDYEVNSGEFKRRVDVCSEEKKIVQARLDKAMEYADNLKKIGVTRTTATFLFVAGFISLAGVGSVISNLLSDRQPGEDVLSRLIQNVGGIADGMVPSQFGQFASVFRPFIFIVLLLLFLGLFYGLIRLMDWLVHRFDSESWGGQSPDSEPNRTPRTIGDQFTGFASSALSISSQISTLFPFTVERRDYTRLLAAFPYLFLGGVIVFLFSAGGKVLSLTTSYIGVIFALLATSVSVLYVTKIIEPRWDIASRANEGENRSLAFARINRELTGLFGLMVLSLLLAAFMPGQSRWAYLNSQQTKLIVWGFIALFMCLSSLGLAYGIIQRGIFKDIDYLIRRRNEYRLLIEKFSMQPILGSSGRSKIYGDDARSAHYSDLIDRVEDHRLWYELNEIFGSDFDFETPPADDALRSAWFSFRRTKGGGRPNFLSFRIKKEVPHQPKSVDFVFAPEQAKAFVTARQRLSRHGQKKAETQSAKDSVERTIAELSTELGVLENRLRADEQAKRELESQFEKQLSDLIMERERELIIFRGDFAFGIVARNLLRGEDILPHFDTVVAA